MKNGIVRDIFVGLVVTGIVFAIKEANEKRKQNPPMGTFATAEDARHKYGPVGY